MTHSELSHYRYRGARALVILHERYMREFLETWKLARTANVPLPETDDGDYQSLEHVLRHALRAARGYMTWMCEKLALPDPQIRPAPEVDNVQAEADQYLEHLLERWRVPLADVPAERFEDQEYPSRWKRLYTIDAMLEHAVVHPQRHAFQLRELMAKAAR